MPRRIRLRRFVLPGVPAGRPRDDHRAGRHFRVGRRHRGGDPRSPATHRHHVSIGLRGPAMSSEVTDPPAEAPKVDPPQSIPWWTKGDTNAFFGLGFNI